MKKFMFPSVCALALALCAFTSARAAEVNEKVLKSFRETFPKAEQVNWQEYSDNYVVNFLSAGTKERITYDKDGNFVSATRYFGEEHLPANVLCKLKKKFPGQKVYGVTEMTTENSSEYYIKLQDESNWTTVKTDDTGSFEVVEKFKKAEE